MNNSKIPKLIISILMCQAAGIIGSFFTAPATATWYVSLVKPSFNPPNWVFAPVWILLFFLMGISFYLVWEKGGENKKAMLFFGAQLVLNVFWSVIFFGLKSPFYAFVEIIVLWLAILLAIFSFYRISKPAAYLLIPYILWVSFAAYLNYSIWNLNRENLIACTQEAKLCPDGSYVSRVAPDCDFALCPKENIINVELPKANEVIASPLIIKGSARGNWFFEASFPIQLFDEHDNLLTQSFAQAKSDWMTTDFVPFEAVLSFEIPETEKGTLVLKKDNPSGLPEHDDELRIPVLFSKNTRTINLYYYNPDMDKDSLGNIMCSREGLISVQRKIPITQTPIQDTINLLLLGSLTDQERALGITSEYPLEGFSLKGASLKQGVLTLEFDDLNNKTSGGACRAGILWFQVEATAKQFEGVSQVRFLPEDLFQP